MSKAFSLLTLYLILTHLGIAQYSDTTIHAFPSVVVTANRIPTSQFNLNRIIHTIDNSMIHSLQAQSLEEILGAASLIDIRPRGPFGTQTDASIRGSLFSQNLILIDGQRMNDPQTAHHNFNIPISLDNIERIEVMPGGGSSIYGADAIGGTINIISKTNNKDMFSIRLAGGEYGFVHGGISKAFSIAYWNSLNTFDYRRSDGHQYDTEFEGMNISSNNTVQSHYGKYSINAGYTKKQFGAFDFYSPGRNIPSKEWITAGYISFGTEFITSEIPWRFQIYSRQHIDKFMFDIRTPTKYVNDHKTDIIGEHLLGYYKPWEKTIIIFGIERNDDFIKSNNLGKHSRSTQSSFLSTQSTFIENLVVDCGIRGDWHSHWGNSVNPSFGLGWIISHRSKIHFNSGRSFRAPSYTDLYYQDPANMGNPLLRPEYGWSYEFGYQNSIEYLGNISVIIFKRNMHDLIDYIQYFNGDLYHAANFTEAKIEGSEMSFEWNKYAPLEKNEIPFIAPVQLLLKYTFLQSIVDATRAFRSKYNLSHAKHQVRLNATILFPYSINVNTSLTHKYKSVSQNHSLVDVRASKQMQSSRIYVNATNIFDSRHEEIIGVSLPGRWMIGGVEMNY